MYVDVAFHLVYDVAACVYLSKLKRSCACVRSCVCMCVSLCTHVYGCVRVYKYMGADRLLVYLCAFRGSCIASGSDG